MSSSQDYLVKVWTERVWLHVFLLLSVNNEEKVMVYVQVGRGMKKNGKVH